MSKALLTALAAAVILSSGVLGNRAEAMTPATPAALGAANATIVQQATNVCGSNGCVRVQTSGPKRRRTHP